MTVEPFCLRLEQDCAVAPGSRVLAAVSGGADSVALLHLLLEAAGRMRLTVLCAHVEHGIRGEASREDAAFVAKLCEGLNVPLYTAHVDAPAYAKEHGCGLEDAARTLRYAFLNETADEVRADCVALAHHARDQAETVLMHASRGSDLRGLCAMRARRGRFVRPLLIYKPEELRAYLTGIGQSWREDETNDDPCYARNRVRLRVLPELEQACPGASSSLARLARAAQRDEDYFDAQLHALGLPKPVHLVDGLAHERESLAKLHLALTSRAIVRLLDGGGLPSQGAEAIEAICEALSSGQEAVINLAGGAHAHIGRRFLCITREEPLSRENALPDMKLNVSGETATPFGVFRVRSARPGETGNGKLTQAIPAHLLAGATVGARREGERIALFGGGHTSVKKLMIEAGVERAMRKSVPIVRGADGEILWIAGVRAGAMCRIPAGEDALLIEYLTAYTAK